MGMCFTNVKIQPRFTIFLSYVGGEGLTNPWWGEEVLDHAWSSAEQTMNPGHSSEPVPAVVCPTPAGETAPRT